MELGTVISYLKKMKKIYKSSDTLSPLSSTDISIFNQKLAVFIILGNKDKNCVSIHNTAQKMKFSIKDFFSKCDQIRSFLRIWSHLLKKSLMANFIFCAVSVR